MNYEEEFAGHGGAVEYSKIYVFVIEEMRALLLRILMNKSEQFSVESVSQINSGKALFVWSRLDPGTVPVRRESIQPGMIPVWSKALMVDQCFSY